MVFKIWIRVSASTYSASASSSLHAAVRVSKRATQTSRREYAHARECGMHRRTANFDRADGVQCAYRRLERLEVVVIIRKHAELCAVCGAAVGVVGVGCAGRDAQADTCMHVLFRGLEPCVALGLRARKTRASLATSKRKYNDETHLFENMVQERVVEVVVHPCGFVR